MSHVATGQQAETAATRYLERKGYRILDRNWRTRQCEVDIIAEYRGVLCFCEVKYRLTDEQGSGLDYITPRKIKQMEFAAESWVHANGWQGEYQLMAIEVMGESFQVTTAVEI
jgi:Holliday junction resolvase-like predicted endonuclease